MYKLNYLITTSMDNTYYINSLLGMSNELYSISLKECISWKSSFKVELLTDIFYI